MAGTIEISLPRSYPAMFPRRCVVCESPTPGSCVRMFAGPLGWWSWLWPGSFSVRAPACPACARGLHVRRVLNLLITVIVTLAVLRYLWPHLQEFIPNHLRRPAQMGLALLCLAPLIAMEVLLPPSFGLGTKGDEVEYEFTSESYAYDFTVLNAHAPWVKVNGNAVEPPE